MLNVSKVEPPQTLHRTEIYNFVQILSWLLGVQHLACSDISESVMDVDANLEKGRKIREVSQVFFMVFVYVWEAHLGCSADRLAATCLVYHWVGLMGYGAAWGSWCLSRNVPWVQKMDFLDVFLHRVSERHLSLCFQTVCYVSKLLLLTAKDSQCSERSY